jgi:hypothetical protein
MDNKDKNHIVNMRYIIKSGFIKGIDKTEYEIVKLTNSQIATLTKGYGKDDMTNNIVTVIDIKNKTAETLLGYDAVASKYDISTRTIINHKDINTICKKQLILRSGVLEVLPILGPRQLN